MTAGLGLLLAALALRLVDLQVIRHDTYLAMAQSNTVTTIRRPPMRGQILDCHGTPLAQSQPAKTVCADPTLISNQYVRVAQVLAPLLQTNEAYLAERLRPRYRIEKGKTNLVQYVVLKRKVPLDTWEKIHDAMSGLSFGVDESKLKSSDQLFCANLRRKAIFPEEDQIRTYPYQRLACHVVGFTATETNEVGMSGIEHSYNKALEGVAGWRKTEQDKRQRELVAFRDEDVAARDGYNVVLTIDQELQSIVESELAEAMTKHSPDSISCTMVRPRTGEILAMANIPNYDLNHPGAFPPDALRNRIISDVAEPGSTFKIVAVTAGLNEHLTTLSEMFNCENGVFLYAGRRLHDHEPFGMLSVENIITKSSNIGAAKIGMRLGNDTLWRYIHNFGFGERTGIDLPAEVSGIVHPVNKWTKVSIAQIPMGQGVAVTALQTVMAMSAIANDGVLMRPMIVSSLQEPGGKVVMNYKPQPIRRVASSSAIRDMVTALKTVPTADGTAVAARLEHYTVAGKTGTAQEVDHGHYIQRFYSSFIGFFPADNPEICISVVMDNAKDGHYGGKTAGPVFHAIAERAADYLNLKPDIAPTQSAQPGQILSVATGTLHH